MVTSQQYASKEANSKVPSSEAVILHPVLKVALTSLDVSLDSELTRYRRHKAGYPAPPPPGFHNAQVKAPETKSTSTAVRQSAGKPSAQTGLRQPASVAKSSPPQSEHGASLGSSPPSLPNPLSLGAASVAATSIPESVAQASPPVSAPFTDPVGHPHPTDTQPAAAESAVTAANHESRIPEGAIQLVASSDDRESTVQSTELTHTGGDPFDYLESSEALLKSLSEEEEPDFSTIDERSGFFANVLTPVGIGSSLILLLSTVTLGYALLMNASGRFSSDSNQSRQALSPGRSELIPIRSSNGIAGLPNSPDLSSKEFVDLNLETLSRLKPSSEAPSLSPVSPAASPQPMIPMTLSGLSSTASLGGTMTMTAPLTASGQPFTTQVLPGQFSLPGQPPVAATTNSPATSYSTPSYSAPSSGSAPQSVTPSYASTPNPPAAPAPRSAPEVSRPAPVVPSSAARSGSSTSASRPASRPAMASPNYTVTSPYVGDRNLQNAQQVVPDAYVRNDANGANIQLGTFNDPEQARKVVEELQRQGIDAQLQQP